MCGSAVLTSSHFLVLMFCCLYWQSREKSVPLIQNVTVVSTEQVGWTRICDSFSDFAEDQVLWILIWCGCKNWRQHPARAGTGWRSLSSSMKEIYGFIECLLCSGCCLFTVLWGSFYLCVSVKEFEAPRSSEDPCVGHTAGKSRIQNTGPNQCHSKAKSHLQSLL